MEWIELYNSDNQPTTDDMATYIGGEAKNIWQSLITYMTTIYKVKPNIIYSRCSGKPGWNLKFQSKGQALGTFYPEQGSFSILLVISYRLDQYIQDILPQLTKQTADLYRNAGDYMKMGKWMMFTVSEYTILEDYKKLISIKLNSH